MLTLLFVVISVFVYLSIGYGLGLVANRLYLDGRPNQDLKLISRLGRLFFFPFSYHEWENRGGDDDIRNMLDADLCHRGCRNRKVEPTKQALAIYCKVTAVAWPLKLIHIPVFIAQVLFFFASKSVGGVGYLIEGVVHGGQRLLVGKTAHRQSELELELDSIKEFAEKELATHTSQLERRATTAATHSTQLAQQIDRWKLLLSEATNRGMNFQRFEVILQNLKERHKDVRESESQTRTAITAIEEKQKELKFLLRILEEYEKTNKLMTSIDPNATLQDEIASTLNAAFTIMEVCRQAYALEGEYLARQNGIDTPTLVAQLEEGQKKQDELEGLIM